VNRYQFFVSPVSLANSPFYQVSVDSSLEVALGDRNQNLVLRKIRIGVRHEKNLKRKQIKRGTLVKEFLYNFFFGKSFCLVECESPHELNLINLPRGLKILKAIICS
jgi:hypothetical protein